MKLVVLQSNVGRYNLLSSGKSFSFALAITNGDRKPIEENGVKAILSFSGEPDSEADFSDPIDNLSYIFNRCLEYALNTWSTVNYKEQCLLFWKLYNDNYAEMDAIALLEFKKEAQEKIDKLQQHLKLDSFLPVICDHVPDVVSRRIFLLNKWIDADKKDMHDLKEGSESYLKKQEAIDKYKKEIESLTSVFGGTNAEK